jgi:hypothetical protein
MQRNVVHLLVVIAKCGLDQGLALHRILLDSRCGREVVEPGVLVSL